MRPALRLTLIALLAVFAAGFVGRASANLVGDMRVIGDAKRTRFVVDLEKSPEYGLKRLDAGAQGEHKLARGFRPVRTWSVHWLNDAGFRRAVAEFLGRETTMIEHYLQQLAGESPYRHTGTG